MTLWNIEECQGKALKQQKATGCKRRLPESLRIIRKLDPRADIYRALRGNYSMPLSGWLTSQALASIDIATDPAISPVFTQMLRTLLFGVTPIDLAAR